MQRCVQLALLAGAGLSASPARAAQPLDLSWQAPLGCPQESSVREQIRSLVPSAMLGSARLKAEGTITRVDKRFRLKLVLHLGDISGERSIESDSCSDLAGAAAVALGLLLQSANQTSADKPGSTPGSDTTGPADSHETGSGAADAPKPNANATGSGAEPAPDDDLTPANGPRQPRSWRLFIAPRLGVDFGPLPKPSLSVSVAAGLSVQMWQFSASFAFPRGQQLQLPGTSGAGARLEHLAVEAWACRAFRAETLELAPCLLIGWESLKASGNGPSVEARAQRTSWVSGGAAAVGRWYVADWFAFAASAGVKVEGARPTISIEGLGDYGRLEPAAFSLLAGPVWIF